MIDLHPAGFASSEALGVSGDTQVGSGNTDGVNHALLWRGSAESVVDMHPAEFRSSGASAVAGKYQVGTGSPLASEAGTGHALIWTGTAESVVDLHLFLADLPYTFLFSNATGVDERGNVVGIGITTQGPVSILWTPVPEPASAILTVLGALSGLLQGHRRLRVGHRLSSGRS